MAYMLFQENGEDAEPFDAGVNPFDKVPTPPVGSRAATQEPDAEPAKKKKKPNKAAPKSKAAKGAAGVLLDKNTELDAEQLKSARDAYSAMAAEHRIENEEKLQQKEDKLTAARLMDGIPPEFCGCHCTAFEDRLAYTLDSPRSGFD